MKHYVKKNNIMQVFCDFFHILLVLVIKASESVETIPKSLSDFEKWVRFYVLPHVWILKFEITKAKPYFKSIKCILIGYILTECRRSARFLRGRECK